MKDIEREIKTAIYETGKFKWDTNCLNDEGLALYNRIFEILKDFGLTPKEESGRPVGPQAKSAAGMLGPGFEATACRAESEAPPAPVEGKEWCKDIRGSQQHGYSYTHESLIRFGWSTYIPDATICCQFCAAPRPAKEETLEGGIKNIFYKWNAFRAVGLHNDLVELMKRIGRHDEKERA